MHALPDIEVTITEYSELEHNRKNNIDRGIDHTNAAEAAENETATAKSNAAKNRSTAATAAKEAKESKDVKQEGKGGKGGRILKDEDDDKEYDPSGKENGKENGKEKAEKAEKGGNGGKGTKAKKAVDKEKEQMYYLVSCRDNGCG